MYYILYRNAWEAERKNGFLIMAAACSDRHDQQKRRKISTSLGACMHA